MKIAKEESNENWQFYSEDSTLGNPALPKLRCIVQCLMLRRSVHRTPSPRLCCIPGAAAYVPRRRTTARATARHHHREIYIELLQPQVYLCRNAFVANLESVKHLLLEVRSCHSCTWQIQFKKQCPSVSSAHDRLSFPVTVYDVVCFSNCS